MFLVLYYSTTSQDTWHLAYKKNIFPFKRVICNTINIIIPYEIEKYRKKFIHIIKVTKESSLKMSKKY